MYALVIAAQLMAPGSEQVPVVVVTTAVHDQRLRNRPIEVCGYLIDSKGWKEGQMLEANGSFLLVEALPGEVAADQGVCVRGVIYRRDGYSEAEAEAARLSEQVAPHGPSATHVLYRCTDLPACRELARTGPKERRANR